jgi:tRNA-uridine 2-sulfurtransferase
MMKYDRMPDGIEATTHIRYNDAGTIAQVQNDPMREGTLNVNFYANVKGVAPGQSAVFYEGDDLIGGGIILGGVMDN